MKRLLFILAVILPIRGIPAEIVVTSDIGFEINGVQYWADKEPAKVVYIVPDIKAGSIRGLIDCYLQATQADITGYTDQGTGSKFELKKKSQRILGKMTKRKRLTPYDKKQAEDAKNAISKEVKVLFE